MGNQSLGADQHIRNPNKKSHYRTHAVLTAPVRLQLSEKMTRHLSKLTLALMIMMSGCISEDNAPIIEDEGIEETEEQATKTPTKTVTEPSKRTKEAKSVTQSTAPLKGTSHANPRDSDPLKSIGQLSSGFGRGGGKIGEIGMGGLGAKGTGTGGGGLNVLGDGRGYGQGAFGTTKHSIGAGRGGGISNNSANKAITRAGSRHHHGLYDTENLLNGFIHTEKDRLSTFAIDVDNGSYTLARSHIQRGASPSPSHVRVEEFVNFFDYNDKAPTGDTPFQVNFEAAPSPFDEGQTLLRIGVQGRELSKRRPPAHLVFLVDVSGSMSSQKKLPLAQRALHLLVNQLKQGDTVAICTYAGRTEEIIQPTGMHKRAAIHRAIEALSSGGSTAMSDGLETAYKMAYRTLKPGHTNRVIVLSDGDANVGRSSHKDILERIKHFTQEGVYLSTIGFGMGNYRDGMMEQLANKGNGNYYYIDSAEEAQRVFTKKLWSMLQVIAKDVKIQVDFNPEVVDAYRLIGYENRDIKDSEFRDDAVDAGEIGAGHNVTALYALKLRPEASPDLNPATVMIRAKGLDSERAQERTYPLSRTVFKRNVADTSRNFRLALTAGAFAEKLRLSEFANNWSWEIILDLMHKETSSLNADERELLALIKMVQKREMTLSNR